MEASEEVVVKRLLARFFIISLIFNVQHVFAKEYSLEVQTKFQKKIWESEREFSSPLEEKLSTDLRSSPYESHQILGRGSSQPWKVTLENGLVGVFKPINKNDEDLSAPMAERLAYEVDLLFGFKVVPVTVIREINGKKGSLQLFYNANTALTSFSDPLMKGTIDILDYLLRNTDRHSENYLIENDRVIAIDNDHILSRSRYDTLQRFQLNRYIYRAKFGNQLFDNLKSKINRLKARKLLYSFNQSLESIEGFTDRLNVILNH